jgi:hypothetical protein
MVLDPPIILTKGGEKFSFSLFNFFF